MCCADVKWDQWHVAKNPSNGLTEGRTNGRFVGSMDLNAMMMILLGFCGSAVMLLVENEVKLKY